MNEETVMEESLHESERNPQHNPQHNAHRGGTPNGSKMTAAEVEDYERVEVLKEGASAIYGTDAIGGVINFILRKDYEGIGVQASVDVAEEGDHSIYRTSAIAGYGDLSSHGFNIMGAVSWSDIPELRANQRDFVDTFQVNRGLSVDTRGTPHATIVGFAGTFFPNNASFPNIPGTTTSSRGNEASGSIATATITRSNKRAAR